MCPDAFRTCIIKSVPSGTAVELYWQRIVFGSTSVLIRIICINQIELQGIETERFRILSQGDIVDVYGCVGCMGK